MSITNLQDKAITIGTPIEIDHAVNEIRKVIATIPWIERAYFIADRLTKTLNGRRFYFPATYAPGDDKRIEYFQMTPDNDFTGRSFFLVGRETIDHSDNSQNRMTYPVALIVHANLELIDKTKLESGLFTRELMRDVRSKLVQTRMNHLFEYTVDTATRDVREVFREFTMDDIENFNIAPMQTFRFDMSVTVQEDCII